MPLGMIILVTVSILIFLGLAQRVLDRMRLSDHAALLFIGAMVAGSYLPDVPIAGNMSINIGGGIIPLILVGYLFYVAGTSKERWRAAAAIVVTTVIVYGTIKLMPVGPTYALLIDPLYFIAIVAGVVGYLAGRSRRAAFMAGISAIVLSDIVARIEDVIVGGRGATVIGGAGIFDATVITAIIAVGLAEIVGETRERLQGGPEGKRPEALLKGLTEVETGEIGRVDDTSNEVIKEDQNEKNKEGDEH